MSTVHTEYGPGRIIAQETVRGRTRFKVAGEGFEVWLDQTKLGGYEPPADIDYDAPHWHGHGPDSDNVVYPEPLPPLSDDEYAEYADPHGLDRGRLRQHPDYLSDDDPDARFANRRRQGGYAEDEMRGLSRGDYEGYDDEYSPGDEYRGLVRDPGLSFDDDADSRYARKRTAGGAGLTGGDVWHDHGNEDAWYNGDFDEPEDLHGLRHKLHLDEYSDDDPARYSNRRRQSGYAEDEMRGLSRGDYEGYDDEYDPRSEYRHLQHDPGLSFDDDADSRYAKRVVRGKAGKPSHLAWAPMDDDNSTALPYNPRPQHDAIGTPGDDNSATIQPIHHIDADERLRASDSLSFDDADDGEEPGPNPDLFAKQSAFGRQASPPSPNMVKGLGQMALDAVGLGDKINLHEMHDKLRDKVRDQVIQRTNNPELADKAVRGMDGGMEGGAAAGTIAAGEYAVGRGLDKLDPGYDSGWGRAIKPASRREANPAALIGPALRVLGPMAVNHLMNGGGHGGGEQGGGSGPGVIDEMMSGTDPGSGWDGVIAEASYRPAGLSDRYIDITAGADYHNDPVAQFRHDPDAYINRIGHLMDEGLNPRFAEYMDLVEGDSSVRTAAWKDVRAKAMRLKTSGAVHVKDIAPSRIMASVDGDHGTYDVVILKGASYGDQSIANWHCACEWGKWAFKRKFTYVGRLCSHAYASYLTMQSAAMKNQKPTRRGPSDMKIVRRNPRDRQYPMPVFAAGRRTADALQNGPERLTPELVVNDTDDAHMFLDVTKDERKDVGPDDVVSDKDIVHFARLMRHCEVTEQPYPRQLVAFLARYAGCNDDSGDDTQADYRAHDADDANEYLTTIRSDADRKQEDDFGNMAERVHEIQDAVEEARAHGADADRFVAMVREADWVLDPSKVPPGPGIDAYNGGQVQVAPPANRTAPVPTKLGPSYQYKVPDGMSMGDYINRVENNNVQRGLPATQSAPASGGNGGPKTPNTPPAAAPKGKEEDSPLPLPPVGNGGKPNAQPPQPGGNNGQATLVDNKSGAGDKGNNSAPTVGKPGDNGGWTKPEGGTKGPVSDGGKAGAENGDNSAITTGEYTVKPGDTLTDIAQRAYGDMNKYEDIAKANGITDVDSLEVGKTYKLDGATGNGNLTGAETNPAGSTKAVKGPAADSAGKATTDAVKGGEGGAGNPGNSTPTSTTPEMKSTTTTSTSSEAGGDALTPAAQSATKPKSTASAKAWLRWAAETDGTTPTTPDQPADASVSTNPDTNGASGAGTGSRSAPATNPAQTTTPGSPSQSETFDPANPEDVEKQSVNSANPGAQAGGSNSLLPSSGMAGMGDIGSMIGQGVGAATDIASGLGGALPGLASGIGSAISGIGSIFASKNDFDDWVRYAYPTGAGDDDDPKTLPHLPFNGSGNPGSLEFTTSEEYADKARKKMDDVTDLGSHELSTPMGKWQRQSAVDDDDFDPYREASIGYSTDDDSDIVRTFQAHLGETALGAGAGGGSGRFDDIAGAAAGFLRTAGRNYSLAEQSELIREGDKGGARNLDSLDLKGTHYEDMHTLGW